LKERDIRGVLERPFRDIRERDFRERRFRERDLRALSGA
jgi:hypothetical protein